MKYLIVGLGNIGFEYEYTRHNIGFRVLDALAKASNTVFTDRRYGFVAETKIKGRTLILLKPSTYMNLSGNAVRYWMNQEKIPIENLLVIVDDLALPFGTLRLKGKGSDAGHNGLKHIQSILNSQNYARLRFGISDDFPRGSQVHYVLENFSQEEESALPAKLDTCIEIIKSFCLAGLQRTMNTFNNGNGQSSEKEYVKKQRLTLSDEDGIIGIADADRYNGYISEDWELNEIVELFIQQMNDQNLIVWKASDDGNVWNIDITNKRSKKMAFREFEKTIEVTSRGLYLIDYTALTMIAQYKTNTVKSECKESQKIEIENGTYNVMVRQLFNPEDLESEYYDNENKKPHFEIVFEKRDESKLTKTDKIFWWNIDLFL